MKTLSRKKAQLLTFVSFRKYHFTWNSELLSPYWDRNNLFHLSIINLFKKSSSLCIVRHTPSYSWFWFYGKTIDIWTYMKKFLENKHTNTDLLRQFSIDATSHYICAKILHREEIVGTVTFDTIQWFEYSFCYYSITLCIVPNISSRYFIFFSSFRLRYHFFE